MAGKLHCLEMMIASLKIILLIYSIAESVHCEVEVFKYTIGSGKREGESQLTIQPDYLSKSTTIDFQARQVGVTKLNRLRVAV